MALRTYVLGTLAVLALVLLFALVMEVSIERALLLAPVLVISVGLTAGLGLIFWRAAKQSLSRK